MKLNQQSFGYTNERSELPNVTQQSFQKEDYMFQT